MILLLAHLILNRQEKAISKRRKNLSTPGKSKSSNMFRRIAGRLGLDFVVAGVKFANHQLGEWNMCREAVL